jgi:hypothetical protein
MWKEVVEYKLRYSLETCLDTKHKKKSVKIADPYTETGT